MAKHHDKVADSSSAAYDPSTGGSVPTTTGGAAIISLVVVLAVCLCICLQFRRLSRFLSRYAPWFLPSLFAPVYHNKDDLVETGLYEKYCNPSFEQNANNATSIRTSNLSLDSQLSSSFVIVKPLPPLPASSTR